MSFKAIYVMGISFLLATCMTPMSGCRHRGRSQARTISASSDAAGTHPATVDVPGPATITCVSARGDTGNVTPPACMIDAPGAHTVVKAGDKLAVATAGRVILTCEGKGTLACTARVEEVS